MPTFTLKSYGAWGRVRGGNMWTSGMHRTAQACSNTTVRQPTPVCLLSVEPFLAKNRGVGSFSPTYIQPKMCLFLQSVKLDLLAWVKSTVFVTSFCEQHGPNRPSCDVKFDYCIFTCNVNYATKAESPVLRFIVFVYSVGRNTVIIPAFLQSGLNR